LSPAGEVTWLALEKDVRSDSDKPVDQAREEGEFLDAASAGRQSVAVALDSLGAQTVETLVLRRERPFVVATTARFLSIERLLSRLFEEAGIDADVGMHADGTRTTLTVRIDLNRVDLGAVSEGPWTAVIEEAPQYAITLTSGRFVEARGFSLTSGSVTAVPQDVDLEKAQAAGELVWKLVWTQ
jgi:hypothetical protein